jgi:hypothetical protein
MKERFAAVHESGHGTQRTCPSRRSITVCWGSPMSGFDPNRDIGP